MAVSEVQGIVEPLPLSCYDANEPRPSLRDGPMVLFENDYIIMFFIFSSSNLYVFSFTVLSMGFKFYPNMLSYVNGQQTLNAILLAVGYKIEVLICFNIFSR